MRLLDSGLMSEFQRTGGPFGDPEGERADTNDFVEFLSNGAVQPSSLSNRARVIVGRKGAGKTLLIRRLQQGAQRIRACFRLESRCGGRV